MKKFIVLLLSILLLSFSASAQLSGPLSGVIDSGEYDIIGNISVQNGDSLIIEPGAVLLFDGNYQFDINGYLYAVGTETDSIKFMPNVPDSIWGGIDFNDTADDSSRLEYCLITGGYATGSWPENCGGGILCYSSSPTISNCTISGNSANFHGGGLYCYVSNPTISNCTISGNSASGLGGGIYCRESNPAISNCTISGNTAYGGGGIYCRESSPAISNCTISGNTAYSGGGISCVYYSSPAISNCEIIGNYASTNGGITCSGNSNAIISQCTIKENEAIYGWSGGITCFASNPTISYCNIIDNYAYATGGGITCHYYASPNIDNCLISGNYSGVQGGGIQLSGWCNPIISNCTITGNSSYYASAGGVCSIGSSGLTMINTIIAGNSNGVQLNNSPGCIINHCDFFNNATGNFSGNSIPSGVGIINTINANGDPCDAFFNIFEDPLFYATSGDSAFFLTENSPCIDAGNPNSPLDPDGSIADIGAFYYEPSNDYIPTVLFATEKIHIKKDCEILSGNVWVNDISQGSSAELKIERATVIAGGFEIKANKIEIKEEAVINADVTYNELVNNGTINGNLTCPIEQLPIVPESNLPEFPEFECGSEDITVEEGDSIALFEGDYDDLSVKKNGILTFIGGIYSFNSFTCSKETFIFCLEPTEIRVKEKLQTGESAYVGPADGSEITAKDIVFYIEETGNESVKISKQNEWKANIYAPNGKISINKETIAVGSFFGKEIVVDKETSLEYDGAFEYSASPFVAAPGLAPNQAVVTAYLPDKTELIGAFPNPFNPQTTLSYALSEAGNVSLIIYNIQGREVTVLQDGYLNAGKYQRVFDGSGLTSGVYFVRLTAGNFQQTQKLLLLK